LAKSAAGKRTGIYRDDVAFHYHRLLAWATVYQTGPISCHRGLIPGADFGHGRDKYTAVFKWKIPNPAFILETMITNHNPTAAIVAREAVEKWGDVGDWRHAIGTGPFILQDLCRRRGISGPESGLLGYDARYPQNKLPYADKLKV